MRPLPPNLTQALQSDGEGLAVLVLRLGALGDVLRTLPVVRLVRKRLPRARIHWVVQDTWAIVLSEHPDLDGLIRVPRRQLAQLARTPRGWPELASALGRLARELRGIGATLALDFHGDVRSGLAGWMSNAPVRLGYAGHQQKGGNRWLTTHRIPPGARRTPRIERNLALVRPLGVVETVLPPCDLPLVKEGSAAAERILAALDPRPFVVIAPGASARQAFKKPPPGLLAGAATTLSKRGYLPLVVWGPGEEDDARRVVERASGAATLAPPTDLRALAALLARAKIFVGGDTGPLQLACAVGCPVLGLYGPTDPEVNRPWSVPHRIVQPAGREYTGVKRVDRARGFDGMALESVERAALELDEAIPPAGEDVETIAGS